MSITDIWVDSPASVAGGRELWAIPKGLCDFDLDTSHRGPLSSTTWSASLERRPIASASFTDVSRAMLRVPFKGTTWQPGIDDTDGEERTAVLQGSSKALPVPRPLGLRRRRPARLDARRAPARVVPAGRLPDVLRLSPVPWPPHRARPRTSYAASPRSRPAARGPSRRTPGPACAGGSGPATFAHVMVAQPGYESAYRDITGDEPTAPCSPSERPATSCSR